MMKSPLVVSFAWTALTVALFLPGSAHAADATIAQNLRQLETDTSEIMQIVHELTDVHGPRLTGSPQLKNAQGWAMQRMKSWGLDDVHLELWEFGHSGWSNQLTEVSVVAPYQAPVTARPLPWTPSTHWLVTAGAVLLLPPAYPSAGASRSRSRAEEVAARAGTSPPPMPPRTPEIRPMPTQAELATYLETMKDKVRGKIVLLGAPAEPVREFIPAQLRRSDQAWKAVFDAPADPPQATPRTNAGIDTEGALTLAEVHVQIGEFLVECGAAVLLRDAGEPRGRIRVQHTNGYGEKEQVPAVVLSNRDYGRIARTLRDGHSVSLRVNVQNQFHPEGRTSSNLIAEIAGSDKRDEIVMLGAHLDSWPAGTGAVDNGTGVAVMMEAMRLLKASGAKPRRTVRIALWTGHEQGLFGSEAYVAKHFGSIERPRPDFRKLTAYVNLDNGTGKPRGAVVFGPSAGVGIVGQVLAEFRDWGFMGVSSAAFRPISDTAWFHYAGLPAIGLLQDPFDYAQETHHTELDTFEEVYEPDVRAAAVEVAALAFALANDEAQFPRFETADVPPVDGRDGTGTPARIRPNVTPYP